jgi:hypothetical protein
MCIFHNQTKSLEEVCASMWEKGYEYGGLVSSARLFVPRFSSREELGKSSNKPRGDGVMWFSSIVNRFEDDDEEEERKRQGKDAPLTLAWVHWLLQQGYHVHENSMMDLLFVKTHERHIINESHPGFGWRSWYISEKSNGFAVNWPAVSEKYGGISVNIRQAMLQGLVHSVYPSTQVFSGWDCDSLAVWDRTCITEAEVVKNAGRSWRYI